MKDPESARQVLDQLRALGVQLAIDDFGTGYSSLAYLRHLPVDCLKVDRSFVAELAAGHAEIATAVIALAGTLNLSTVAEGVETAEQAARAQPASAPRTCRASALPSRWPAVRRHLLRHPSGRAIR